MTECRSADTNSHSVWALAREDGEFSVTLRPFGQAKIDFLRHGAALLASWAEVSSGIFVLQERCTSIHAFEPANVDAAKALVGTLWHRAQRINAVRKMLGFDLPRIVVPALASLRRRVEPLNDAYRNGEWTPSHEGPRTLRNHAIRARGDAPDAAG